jgi:hypothetical protein
MNFMGAFFAKPKFRGRRRSKPDDGAGEAVLFVSAGDAGWSAELTGREGARWKQQVISVPDSGSASPPEQLALAVARLSTEQPQANVKRVVLLIDDPDLQLVDHRFAKLTNFEPRALKEFGAQQAGGRAIVYGSLPFGASSAREIEKRVLAFLPEEKLESYFFGLGKLATALVAVIPAGVQTLRPESHEGGIFATLRVHGEFTTLLVANGDTGIIAVRQFPFGALTLAKAYASEHGVSLEESSAALRMRSRLPPASAVKDGAAPEHKTATFAALSPPLRQLHDDVAATLDYFRYQRLAGRPAHLSLTFTAPPISGLDTWLEEALDLQVDVAANVLPAFEDAPETPMLNLLEGSRSGLLKMGNQPYEFSRGRLLPIKGAQSEMSIAKHGSRSGLNLSLPWLEKLIARAGGRQLTLRREQIMQPLYGVALAALLAIGNVYFLTAPAQQHLIDGASAYGTAAGSSVASAKTGSEADLAAGERATLWADNLFAVGKSVSPSMKLERLELVPVGGKAGAGADLSFAITGALPPGGANLTLVAGFIDHLSQDKSFSQRFAQLRFTGAGESEDEMHHEMLFHVVGLSGGAKK